MIRSTQTIPQTDNPRLQPPAPERPWIQQPHGLGDAVKVAAKPVVMLVKMLGGPDLGGCGGCRKRQEFLNNAAPNINPFRRT